MNKLTFKAKRTLAAFALASASLAASAVTISSSIPSPFSWSFSSAAGDLSGNGTITVSGFNSSQLNLDVTLNNSSAVSNNRLVSFGFGIDPNATSITFVDANDNGMVDGSLVSQLTGNLKDVEVCAFGGPNCNGGGSGGIDGGASDSFTLQLGGTWGSSVTLAPIGFKYQTGAGSFEFTTSTSTSTSSTGGGASSSGTVPEPGTGAMALLGLGLLGAGFGMRRRQPSV